MFKIQNTVFRFYPIALMFCACLGTSAFAEEESQRPNIMVILVDDLGYSDLGFYGSEIRTPHLDQLCSDGIPFTHGYNAARCSPSRASILTGQYYQTVAVKPAQSLSPMRLDNNATIAELLAPQGYTTYAVGKWHLGTRKRAPEHRGFQHFWGFKDGHGDPPYGKNMWRQSEYRFYSTNNEISERQYENVNLKKSGDHEYAVKGPNDFYQSDVIGDYATDFVKHSGGKKKPFFMYVAFGAPHFPVQAYKEDVDQYLPTYQVGWDEIRNQRFARQQKSKLLTPEHRLSNRSDSPEWARQPPKAIPAWKDVPDDRKPMSIRMMALYAATITSIDENVGKITAALKSTGQLENTLIVFVSDNGADHEGGIYGSISPGYDTPLFTTQSELDSMGQPTSTDLIEFKRANYLSPYLGAGWANATNTPYKYYKRNNHEGGIASPFIVHWPAGTQAKLAGKWHRNAVSIIDIMPTALEITNTPFPKQLDDRILTPLEAHGRSLSPLLQSNNPVPREFGFEHEANRAYRLGDWKFVTKNYLDSREEAHTYELYNLKNDPTEITNLAEKHSDKLRQLVTKWNAWAKRVGVSSDRLLPIN